MYIEKIRRKGVVSLSSMFLFSSPGVKRCSVVRGTMYSVQGGCGLSTHR